jgi:hypothetical protein
MLPPAPEQKGVIRGLGLTLVLHVAALLAVCVVSLCIAFKRKTVGGGLAFVLTIGLSQWLYMAPALWYTRRRGWTGIHKGLWIGGAITLLLSALCWGTALVMISRNGY